MRFKPSSQNKPSTKHSISKRNALLKRCKNFNKRNPLVFRKKYQTKFPVLFKDAKHLTNSCNSCFFNKLQKHIYEQVRWKKLRHLGHEDILLKLPSIPKNLEGPKLENFIHLISILHPKPLKKLISV